MNRTVKKILALLLAACMLVPAVPAYAADNSVTVYFSLSSDGVPVIGADGTVLARHKVTVPYFDLGLYGLQHFYRYETNGDFGDYVNSNIVQKPTVLHLYIYMLERYYQGLPKSQCGKGNLDFDLIAGAYTREGEKASQGQRALMITGGAKSMYMSNFWGHDENLMYFVNHQYPLMNPGWGSTADYILLENGMDISVAMFTNWNFYHYGSFMYFERDSYSFSAGEQQTLRVLGGQTSGSVQGDFTTVKPEEGMTVYIWDESMSSLIEEVGQTDENGCIDYTFESAGTYTISAEDPNRGTGDAAHAPAVATVRVAEKNVSLQGLSFDKALYTLDYGNTWQLVPTLDPVDATNVTMTWESSDPNIVTVNDIGVLGGKGSGTAKITCTATDGKNTCSASCEVYVGEVVDVTGIDIIPDSVTLAVGEMLLMDYAIKPDNANNQIAAWRTSECPDFNVNYTEEEYITAKIDHLGMITAKNPGVVTVYVRTNDGGFTDICTVTVVEGGAKGDPNSDGNINASDILALKLHISGKKPLDGTAFASADANGDGSINASDILAIKLHISGKKPLTK